MAINQVNPTRMELTKLKSQLAVAKRGHHLLKDKQDEMVRQFMVFAAKSKELRMAVEALSAEAMSAFKRARSKLSQAEAHELTALPALRWELSASKTTSMGIDLPHLGIVLQGRPLPPYALNDAPEELDEAILSGARLLPKLVELAQCEKTIELFALEIEKTRRRVNAIEHVMIPKQVALIKDIKTKLADQEMAGTIRVMKSKEIILKKVRAARKSH